MTKCIYCKIEVEKKDLCGHQHGAHKSCCSKNSEEFLNHIVKQFGDKPKLRFVKEIPHIDYIDKL